MNEPLIYLDHATTARMSDQTISAMQPFFKRHWHCLSAPYLEGKEPFVTLNQKMRGIKRGLGANEKDLFIFTSSSAEAISQIYSSLALNEAMQTGKNHFVTVPTAEAPFITGIKRWEGLGICQKLTPLNEKGVLTPENLEKVLSPRTGLVSLPWAHGLTGVVQPIVELAELCQEKKIPFHVDVSDVLGKRYLRFEDLPIDYLTFDGDRLHGPKGTGGLLVRHPKSVNALIADGMQQGGYRGGTFNLPGFVGLGHAIDELEEYFNQMCLETARLRQFFEESVTHALPDVEVLFKDVERLPNVSLMTFPGVRSELLAFHLAKQGIQASFGGGHHQTLETLLKAVGIDEEKALCALSFSLGRETTEAEMQKVSGILADTVAKCQTFSKELRK